MKNSYFSYLDDFKTITLLVDLESFDSSLFYFLKDKNNEITNLRVESINNIYDRYKIILKSDIDIYFENDYTLYTSNNTRIDLYTGAIYRSINFDNIYNVDDKLGYKYSKNNTTFRVFSLSAKRMYLEIINDNLKEYYKMNHISKGIWEITINKDIEGYKYRYKALINGKYKYTYDPYTYSLSTDNKYSYIIDFSKTKKVKVNNDLIKNPIIYETNINDFSYNFNILNKCNFDAFIVSNLKNKYNDYIGFDYIKSLKINYIELMPITSYSGIDINNKFKKYNWGYNPLSYFSIENTYSLNPANPYSSINEFKELINKCHSSNIKVIMDVVYNHVYNPKTFPYEVLNPGYMNVYDEQGMLENESGCKNDLDTSRFYIRKMILDSLSFFVEEYKVDGFRFDLMGLIDIDTMQLIKKTLLDINPNILLFGEGWMMGRSDRNKYLNHMYNNNSALGIYFFSDKFRENIKNFVLDKEYDKKEIISLINNDKTFINYVSCHDDYTLYDYISLNSLSSKIDNIKKCNLALIITILSKGISFISSGSEFFRSKHKKRNTYNSSYSINSINWENVTKYKKYIDSIKWIIDFKLNNEIYNDINSLNNISILDTGTIMWSINNGIKELIILFKNNKGIENFNFNDYKILFNGSNKKAVNDISCIIMEKLC